jgi:hypothetical protein
MRLSPLAAAFVLVGTVSQAAPREGSYCSEFDRGLESEIRKLPQTENTPQARRIPLERCIQHNAQELSVGTDSADTIADIVIERCSNEAQTNIDDRFAIDPSYDTRTNREHAHKGSDMYVRQTAREVVMRSRAAHCDPQNH